jgi:DNA mismatch repair protein MutS
MRKKSVPDLHTVDTAATQGTSKTPTPSMRQYLQAKEQYPDALMFFRIGDFYELFYQDAITTSKALELKLTSRDKNDPDAVPMCGVPHHAVQYYLARLLEHGFNVAICEQLEDPAKAKGIVKRAVVRVLTPALVLDGDALTPRANQFVAAIVPPDNGPQSASAWGFAAYDLTTGELFAGESADLGGVTAELARLDARELIVTPECELQGRSVCKVLPRVFLRVQADIGRHAATEALLAVLGARGLQEQGEGSTAVARHAAGVALNYAKLTQPNHSITVHRLVRLDPRDYLVLDETAQQHLELFATTRGEKKGSVLAHIDATITPMGARRLRTWLAFPLIDVKRIKKRHDAVSALISAAESRERLTQCLDGVADIERIAVRATLGAITPKDLGLLRDSLQRIPAIHEALEPVGPALKSLRAPDECAIVRNLLLGAIADNPAVALGDGGVFRKGYDARLDELLQIAGGGREAIAKLEVRERERTKIGSLKIAFNRVFGYYIEVTKPNLKNVPTDYKRKQTVAGGERFISEELIELEKTISSADEQSQARERELFDAIAAQIAAAVGPLTRLAGVLADLDALCSLASTAHRLDYVRPEVDDGVVIALQEARHPVVEAALEPGAFVPNDVTLDSKQERLLLVTGPNMAGKSTLMRMVALHVILAQMGAFVPARTARIGVVDRVFTRVGASDDLSRGRSTFMVEMTETATILRGATTRSLVVFDEIGRGTSTYDGLAIAWAVAEYLHDVVRCRALFATHYHELCTLADAKPHAANVNVSAREHGDDIVFLHKLQPGGASRSYGIAVARLAGLPEPVVARAKAMLKDLERGEGPGTVAKQVSLFEPRPEAQKHPVLSTLEHTEVDRMTPIESLNFLAQLKAMLGAASAK